LERREYGAWLFDGTVLMTVLFCFRVLPAATNISPTWNKKNEREHDIQVQATDVL
jgi:hypothetical protein